MSAAILPLDPEADSLRILYADLKPVIERIARAELLDESKRRGSRAWDCYTQYIADHGWIARETFVANHERANSELWREKCQIAFAEISGCGLCPTEPRAA